MELREIRAHAVFQDEAFVAAVVRLTRRSLNADLRRYARDDQAADSPIPENQIQVCGEERSFAGLIDDRLAGHWFQFVNNVMAVFAAHEHASHGALVTDPHLELAACFLRGWAVAQVRSVTLPGM